MISKPRKIGAGDTGLAVSLLFTAGCRPGVEEIRRLAESQGGFSISYDPGSEGGKPDPGAGAASGPVWLELLANGLTFDISGLAPGAPATPPPFAHTYALAAEPDLTALEALTVRPGPHLAGGHGMIPVIRSLAWLAASLAQIDRVEAISWHPARSWCGPSYFRDGVVRWVEGGVFPSLGLTALSLAGDGGMLSEGLALFTGQELRIEPELMVDRAEGAKIAVRLIDFLIENGQIDAQHQIKGPDGQALRIEPSINGRYVRVWRA